MSFLSDFVSAVYFFIRALADVAIGRKRRKYTSSTVVKAPKDVVWQVANANDITFEGPIPMSIKMAKEPDADGLVSGTVTMMDTTFPLTYRLVDMKPGIGTVLEILPEGTSPAIALGKDYFVSFVLTEEEGGTRLDTAHELTHDTFASRITIPLGAIQNSRRLAAHAEKLAGIEPSAESAIGGAVLTGVITFASFFLLWGLDAAALLIGVILIHELGHVLAMRWVGQPVRGIFFIPFLGGVAVASAPHATEGNRGFVALMGPGLSIVSTLVFYLLWQQDPENDIAGRLALMSAILNVINLAPIAPLDGGQVMSSLLSRADPELKNVVTFGTLLATSGIALYLEFYVILAIAVLMTTRTFTVNESSLLPRPATISATAGVWLLVGYLSSIAFYLAIISKFVG